jgi:uracil-DNA glycosylase family 4
MLSEHTSTVLNCINRLGLEYQVLGSGSPSSQIVVIAEFPGEAEVQLKTPLVGGSGRYLWEQLGKVGIKREQCYVTNVVKVKLTEDKNTNKRVLPKAELEKWHTVLREELSLLPNARFVLVLGNVALEALTGHTGITKWRGSALHFTKEMGFRNNGQMVITYNPAFVFRDPKVGFHFWIDVQRFKRVYDGTWKPYEIVAHINPTKRQVLDYIRKIRSDGLAVSTDIETIGNETACIGLANDNHEGLCINFRTHDNPNNYDSHDESTIRIALAELFADRNLEIVAQNGNFDSYWLYYKDRLLLRSTYDTLLAHHTLYPVLPHNLGFLTTQYTEHPYYKDEKDTWKTLGDIGRFWEYNVKDCCITRAVYRSTMGELEQSKLMPFFRDHVMKLQPHLVTMTVNGILQDGTLKASIAEDLTHQLDELERDVVQKARLASSDPNLELNPRSSQQLANLFFNILKLSGRGTSTNEENRTRMKMHPNTSGAARELIDAINKYKEEHKFYSTYVDTATDPDGRMRSEYRQWGTQSAPGRLSSSSVMWGSGTNLQNQPDRARAMFVAPSGYRFGYFDLSQAEARYVARAWNVKKLEENFTLANTNPEKYDVHRLNAAVLFKVPYEQVPTADFDSDHKPTLRYKGKRSVHGFNYRLGPEEAASKFGISLVDATHAYRSYHATFPEIAAAWSDILARVKKDRVLYNCFGRRWILLSRLDDEDALRSIVAFEPQSSIGDKVCQVIYQCHTDKEWPRTRNGLEAAISLNIHDALVCLARDEHIRTCLGIMHKYATRPLIVRGTELAIPAELGMSEPDDEGVHRWSTIKKFKLDTPFTK